MIIFLLVLQIVLGKCVFVSNSSICSPFRDYFIDTEQLGHVYGREITIATWESLIESISTGGNLQRRLWNQYFGCPKYRGELLQYQRSYLCLNDIFHSSSSCNQNPPTIPVCSKVCTSYRRAVFKLLRTKSVCSEFTSNVIALRRRMMIEREDPCLDFVKDEQDCVSGVELDQWSCGSSGSW
jgi:hypothetical protein